jgi:hypothetical protein
VSTNKDQGGMWQMVWVGLGICFLVGASLVLYSFPGPSRSNPQLEKLVWDVAPELSGKIEISDCATRGSQLTCVVRNHTGAQIFDANPVRAYTITCFDGARRKLYETWMRPVEAQTAERQDLCPWEGLQRVRIIKEKL